MAGNILRKGFPLSVYNRTPEKAEQFRRKNVPFYQTPKELAGNCDVIISMVTGPSDVKEVILEEDGAAAGAEKGTIIIDMSTIGPAAAREVEATLAKKGMDFLDAPVTGSTPKAISGELTIFVGGERKVFDCAKNVLSAMGTNVFYIGPSGSGQAIKLVNNLLVGETLVALAEGMLLAQRLGLSMDQVEQFLADVPVVSPYMKMKMPGLVSGRYPLAFSVSNLQKDLKLALTDSHSGAGEFPILEIAEKLYIRGKETGLADEDISTVIELLKKPVSHSNMAGKGKKEYN